MKKLTFLLILFSRIALAQNLGFNGSGFFENYNAEVEQYLTDMQQPFTIRVPGGSISKFHDPYNVQKGWGLSEKNIQDWFDKTGFDEDGNGLEKWMRKAGEQPDHSYLDDLIALQKKFPSMQVIYVLNVLNSTPEANMQAIRYLMQNHVRVVGVEAGNEVYGKYASFSEYVSDFEPVFSKVEKEFPAIKKSLIAGANLNRKELVKWNDDLAAYSGNYDAVSIHYYYTAKELGSVYDMIPLKTQYDPASGNADLDKAFTKAAEVLMEKRLLEDGIAYAKNQFKGKEIWITEWNTKPSERLCNTIVNGAWQFQEMMTLRDQVPFLIMHNGVSPDKYGMISKRSAADSEQGDMLKRIGYWSYMLASEAGTGPRLIKGEKVSVQKDADGKTAIWFTNLDAAYKAEIDYGKDKTAVITINYVSGSHLYSAAGTAGYMGKKSTPSYEVNGIQRETFSGTIPQNAYGYILVTYK